MKCEISDIEFMGHDHESTYPHHCNYCGGPHKEKDMEIKRINLDFDGQSLSYRIGEKVYIKEPGDYSTRLNFEISKIEFNPGNTDYITIWVRPTSPDKKKEYKWRLIPANKCYLTYDVIKEMEE